MKNFFILALVLVSLSLSASAQKWRVVTNVSKTGNATTGIYSLIDSTYYDYGLNSDNGSSKMADSVLYSNSKVYANHLGNVTLRNNYTRVYDINGKPVNTLDIKGNDTITEVKVSYSPTNKVKDVQHFSLDGPPNGLSYRAWSTEGYTYNASDLVSLYSTERYNLVNGSIIKDKTYHYYDANNLLTSDTLYSEYPPFGSSIVGYNTYVYDAQGRLIRDTSAYFVAVTGNVVIDTVRGYGYNAQNQLMTDTVYKGSLLETHYYSYDASSNLTADSVVKLSGSYVTTYEYTSFDKIAKIATHAIGSTFDYYVRLFNYEIYWPVNVSSTSKDQTDIHLYPVPNSGILTVEARFKNVEQLRVTITDLQGRVIRSWHEQNVSSYKKQIPIHSLSSGQYFISFDTGEQLFTKKFTVQ